jgi:hypothetical protein
MPSPSHSNGSCKNIPNETPSFCFYPEPVTCFLSPIVPSPSHRGRHSHFAMPWKPGNRWIGFQSPSHRGTVSEKQPFPLTNSLPSPQPCDLFPVACHLLFVPFSSGKAFSHDVPIFTSAPAIAFQSPSRRGKHSHRVRLRRGLTITRACFNPLLSGGKHSHDQPFSFGDHIEPLFQSPSHRGTVSEKQHSAISSQQLVKANPHPLQHRFKLPTYQLWQLIG